jgi:hypothetical protein
LREEAIIQLAFDLIMDDDGRVTLELSLLAFNIKKDVGILDSFLYIFKKLWEKKNS